MKSNKKVSKTKNKARPKQKQPKKKFRIRYEKVLLFFVVIVLVVIASLWLYDMPIKNIIVKGNYYLTDQEIIDMAKLRNYPSTIRNSTFAIEDSLSEKDMIENVKVTKKNFITKVVIEVDENRPLFYYQPENKTVLEDGKMVDSDITVPILINQVPDTVFEELIEDMGGVPLSVLDKMSEIKYVPTDVDPELFLITMNDGIYVYVTLSKFERIYNYIEYAEGFEQKKGILHLDSGDYLEILEED